MFKEILKVIKKYNTIVIARHIGGDIDAIGSQIGLKELLKENFPTKNIYAIGSYSSKFKFIGSLDKEEEINLDNSLLIVLDTPKVSRLDIEDLSKYSYKIKIDHHPLEEEFCDIELVDEKKSSTCEMIIELCDKLKLKMNKSAAEKLYMGIVSDTNRFLYPCTSSNTLKCVANIMDKYNIDISSLYEKMYMRNLDELKFMAYIFENIKVTKNKVAYIKVTDEIQKKYCMDAASTGNMVSELSYVKDFIVWITFSEDKKQNIVRVSLRSRGPAINSFAMKYNGGGHKLASGIRLSSFDLSDEIIDGLDKLCEKYLNDQK